MLIRRLFAAVAEKSSSPELLLLKVLLVLLASTICFGVYLGFTDKAVFYYNSKDVAISFAPFILVGVGGILGAMFQESQIIVILVVVATALSTSYAFGFSAYNAHRFNRGLLWKVIPVTLGKIFLSFIFLFNLMLAFNDKNQKRVQSAIWAASIGWLTNHLVNGDRIFAVKAAPSLE